MKTGNSVFKEKRTVHTVCKFGGVNRSSSACDGDVYDARNTGSDKFPAASRCRGRLVVNTLTGNNANATVGADEKLFYTSETNFVYDGIVKGTVSDCKKNFAVLNDTVVIFPDKKYYRHDITVYRYYAGKMIPCNNGEQYTNAIPIVAISYTEPQNGNEGDKYYNLDYEKLFVYTQGTWTMSNTPDIFSRYSLNSNEFGMLDAEYTWDAMSTGNYVLETVGDDGGEGNSNMRFTFYRNNLLKKQNFNGLKVGDTITVTGVMVNSWLNFGAAEALSEGTVITDIGSTYITVKNTTGITDVNSTQSSAYSLVKFKRIVPTLTCVARIGDRLWGAYKNTIYASAPNSPYVWGYDNGVCNTVRLASGIPGDIIGCADYGGVPVFFTENAIIKVLSVYNGYKISVTPASSLSEDSKNSIAFIGDALYYISASGVMCYRGSSPQKVESNLGIRLRNMVGASDGSKYYLSDGEDTYVFDPAKNIWCHEYGGFTSLARLDSALIGIGSYYTIYAVFLLDECSDVLEPDGNYVEYAPGNPEIIFAPFFEGTHSKKTFTRLFVTAKTIPETILTVYVAFDGKPYEHLGSIRNKNGINTVEFQMLPVRADYMTIKIMSNFKDFELISLSREFITHEGNN